MLLKQRGEYDVVKLRIVWELGRLEWKHLGRKSRRREEKGKRRQEEQEKAREAGEGQGQETAGSQPAHRAVEG